MEAIVKPDSFETFGLSVREPIKEVANESAVINATEEAITAYRNLGMLQDAGQARERFGEEFDALHSALQSDGVVAPIDMMIVPLLTDRFSQVDLISRFVDCFKRDKSSSGILRYEWADYYISREWEKFTPEELNQGQTAVLEPQAVLLKKPSSHVKNNNSGELFYEGTPVRQQLKAIKRRQARAQEAGLLSQPSTMSLAGYIIRQTMLLERDAALMDSGSDREYTLFPELSSGDHSTCGAVSVSPDLKERYKPYQLIELVRTSPSSRFGAGTRMVVRQRP